MPQELPQEPLPQTSLHPEPIPVSPDLLAWARQTFDAGEYLEGVRDIETNGGEPLESFIAAVEAAARKS